MRVYVESFGCAQNHGEGAAIVRDLASRGHDLLERPDGAEVAVLVTCGVIGPTERRMVRRWEALAGAAPRTIVTGCLVPLRTSLFAGEARARTTFVPIREQAGLPALLGGEAPPHGDPPTPRRGEGTLPSVTEEVVLAQGCTSGCAYCFSRLARGTISSVPSGLVVARVRSAIARGAREIRLTGLDTAAWGTDLPGGATLPRLLRELAVIEEDHRLRVGMMSPQSLIPLLSEHAAALRERRTFRFLHLPVQSGSDRILAAMHRGYTVGQFKEQVAALRRAVPDLHVATDLIVGYPGESENDHHATEALLEETAPETVNVTRFSARPGTPAARLPPLPSGIVKRRSRALATLRQRVARARLERWIGERRVGRVLEYGPGESSVARLDNYLPVVLDRRAPLGSEVELRVDGARSTYLVGHVVGAPSK